MKKNMIEIYAVILCLFICIIVFNLFLKNNYLLSGSIIIISIYSVNRFGLMKNNNYLNLNICQLVVVSLLSFFVITYMSGLLLGFNKTIFSFKPHYIFDVIILEFLVIVAEEILRYIVCKNSFLSRKPIVFYTIVMIILNTIIEINGFDLSNKELQFIFFSTVLLPVVSRELLCSYMTYKVSYTPSIIFKSVIVLYQYVFPIIPNLGNYLYSVANVLLPYFIYLFSSKTIEYREKSKKYVNKTTVRIIYIPLFIVLTVLVLLVSGIFTYKMISIGSNSMSPVYERGDAIIYEKTTPDKLKEGEVLVFKHNDTVVTHRIVNLYKFGEHYTFRTKGDANNTVDGDLVDGENVLGKVRYRIKYIGYPTLWLRGIFEGREISDNG